MKFIKISIPLFAMLFFVTAAQAQQKGQSQLTIQYNAGLPMGSFKDNVSEKSFRGMQASILYGLTSQFSIGFGTGFQDFYQKTPRRVYKLSDGSDISAVQTYSIQTIPLLVQGKYQFSPGAAVQPYAALGVGGNMVSFADLLGEFGSEQKAKFGFAARPEAGVFIPFGKTKEAGFTLGASYNIMPFKATGFSNLNHIGVHAGVSIPLKK